MPNHPYAACALVFNGAGNVLMVSRKDNLIRFGLPGGKVDPGENFLDAACRELFEETGLTAYTADYVYDDLCGHESRGETVYYTVTYLCRVVGEIKTSEAGIVKWRTPQDSVKDKDTDSFSEYNYKLLKKVLR